MFQITVFGFQINNSPKKGVDSCTAALAQFCDLKHGGAGGTPLVVTQEDCLVSNNVFGFQIITVPRRELI